MKPSSSGWDLLDSNQASDQAQPGNGALMDFTREERNRIAMALAYEADRLNEIAKSYEVQSTMWYVYVEKRNKTEELEKRFR